MKLIPTGSQTVGPFFSIGLAPLCQDTATANSAGTVTIRGAIFDGELKPIPDAVLEFWRTGEFARVPTADDGTFAVALNQLQEQTVESGTKHFEVLIFMRGLLKPVYTRMYLADVETLRGNPELKVIPTDRIATLTARKTAAPNEYEWNIFMQGENETVFFGF